jgi:hypothetical protein
VFLTDLPGTHDSDGEIRDGALSFHRPRPRTGIVRPSTNPDIEMPAPPRVGEDDPWRARPRRQQKLAARPQGAYDIVEVAPFVGEVFGRLHRPYQVERRGRELEMIGILNFKCTRRSTPATAECSRASLAWLGLRVSPVPVHDNDRARWIRVPPCPQPTPAHERRRKAPGDRYSSQASGPARLQHFLLVQNQSIMDVVAPESPVNEGQRVVVVSDLISRDGHRSHQF